ncbi:SecDF P1 head subdomain-containing protein [Nocardioides limicola]|uniref:SecDF P1 head subdomain-containing protein n=1 Tax=Nocardioides limicola TaxID=2803368 RepID=UPI00193BCC13|nr:hypothetical protein [Nocardioides sp. DJM-14]
MLPRTGAARTLVAALLLIAVGYGLVALVDDRTPLTGPAFSAGTEVTLTLEEPATRAELRDLSDVIAGRTIAAELPGAQVRYVEPDQIVVTHPGGPRPGVEVPLTRPNVLGIRVVARSGPAAAPAADEADDEADDADADDPDAGDADIEYGDPLIWSVSPDADSLTAFGQYTCTQPDLRDPGPVNQPLLACDDFGQKFLLSPVVVAGENLSSARAVLPTGSREWTVRLRFDREGSRQFSEMSQVLAGGQRQFAIVLDDHVVSAPRMSTAVLTGEAHITGAFTEESAKALAQTIDAGQVPVTFSDDVGVEAVAAGTGLRAATFTGGAFVLLVLLGSALIARRFGTVALVLPLAFLAGLAALYPLVVFLGVGVSFVTAPATLVPLAGALLVGQLLGIGLIAELSRSVATGQSATGALPRVVAPHRRTTGLALWVPIVIGGIFVATLSGTLRDAGLALVAGFTVALFVHLTLTCTALTILTGRLTARACPAEQQWGRRPRLMVIGALLLVAVIGAALRRPEAAADLGFGGETSHTRLLVGLALAVLLVVGWVAYRSTGPKRPALFTATVAADLVVVAGLLGLVGLPSSQTTTAAWLTVLALSVSAKLIPHAARQVALVAGGVAVAGTGAVAAALGTGSDLWHGCVVLLLGLLMITLTSPLVAPALPRATAERTEPGGTRTRTRKPRKSDPVPVPVKGSKAPVKTSGAAKRQQPTRQPRSKRGGGR